MKTLILDPRFFLFSVISLITLNAQSATPPLKGRVYTVILTEDKKPAELAVVSLLRVKDSTFVQMVYSNKDGLTEFGNVEAGEYILKVAQFGYRTNFSASFKITVDAASIVLPNIVLSNTVKN